MTPAVLVTGASSGIGRATARHLGSLGMRVFGSVRRGEDRDALAAEGVDALVFDVTDAAALEQAAKGLADRLAPGGLAGLVNNAGIALGGVQEHLDLDVLRHQLEVNVVGVAAATRAFLPLIRRGGGRIVNVGSQSGYVASPFLGPYTASKYAIEGLTDSLRRELRAWGIEVVLIEPGNVVTPIWAKGRGQTAALRAELPREAAAAYAPLLDPISRYIDDAEAGGVAPLEVAKAIARALTAKRPRTRYRVGADARISWWLARFLPDRALDALLIRLSGLPRRL